jgi:gastrin-releasing peptide receptor
LISLVENGTLLSKQKLINQGIEMRSNQKTEAIRSRNRHITLMLLAVSVVFLLLTLPNSIYFVLEITYSFNTPPIENDYSQWLRYRRFSIVSVIMFQLSDLQHATNFFLYLSTSDKFRRSIIHTLLRLLTCGCQRQTDFNRSEYGMSFRSSVSDLPSMMQKSRHKIHKPQQIKLSYRYHSMPSKSHTTTTTDLS